MKCDECPQFVDYELPESYDRETYCKLGYEPEDFKDGEIGCRHWGKYIRQGIRKS